MLHLLHSAHQDPIRWEEFFALRKEMDRKYFDPFNIRTAEEWKHDLYLNFKGADFIFQGVIDRGGKYVGYFRYFTMPDGMNNTFFFFAKEEEVDDDLVQEVWTAVQWWMRKKEHTKMVWRSRQEFWIPFKEKLGGRKGNTGVSFRLYMKDVKRDQLEQWIREGRENTEGFTLIEQDFLEDKYLSEMAELADQLVKDMPREDGSIQFRSTADDIRLSHDRNKAAGFKQRQLILVDPNGKMAATTLILFKHEDMEIDQRITGVERSFRRKGLAKYLKALMMKEVLQRYPQSPSIRTECFAMNIPMINLNKEMGYTEVAREVDHVFERSM